MKRLFILFLFIAIITTGCKKTSEESDIENIITHIEKWDTFTEIAALKDFLVASDFTTNEKPVPVKVNIDLTEPGWEQLIRAVEATGRHVIINLSDCTGSPYWFDYNNFMVVSVILPKGIDTIAAKTFQGFGELSSLTIPDTVTTIEAGAFAKTGLKKIVIPNSVTTIESNAFGGCEKLESVTLPDKLTVIEEALFSSCKSLTGIKIPDSVTSIKKSAFASSGIKTIALPKGLTIIEESLFERGKLESIIIPDSITSIKESAFNDNPALASVTIGKNVVNIGGVAFRRCVSLTSIVIPDSVKHIGKRAFFECRELASVTLSNSLITIDERAFEGCTALTGITLPDSLKVIGQEAFAATALTNITIPAASLVIENRVFSNTPLTGVTFAGKEAYLYFEAFPGDLWEKYLAGGMIGTFTRANVYNNIWEKK